MSDADGENSETQVWLQFAWKCKYISEEEHEILLSESEEVGKLIGNMMSNPGRYR